MEEEAAALDEVAKKQKEVEMKRDVFRQAMIIDFEKRGLDYKLMDRELFQKELAEMIQKREAEEERKAQEQNAIKSKLTADDARNEQAVGIIKKSISISNVFWHGKKFHISLRRY